MAKEQAEFLKAALIFAGMNEEADGLTILPTYSGRGMFGKETHAVSFNGNMGDLLIAVIHYMQTGLRNVPFFPDGSFATDQLGRNGIVVY